MKAGAYCGRFAPSPTGLLHLGTARTALLAWLRARQAGGRFLIRIEDLDTPRVVSGSQESILNDLKWLGLDWDGEVLQQSLRLDLYQEALESLKTRGQVYACSCTRKEIASIASAPHDDDGPPYPGSCRERPLHPERPLAWRFRMPGAAPESGDYVVQRADGVFAYQLACAVDDAATGITEVVRAEDLKSSEPRQKMLIEALGHKAPFYLHVPLMLDPDGQRLSKRYGSIAIAEYRDSGKGPEEVIAMLASSLDMTDEGEGFMPKDMLARFKDWQIK